MRIVVLGGSPKGEISVTMQYVKYLQMKFPEHVFEVFQVAQQIGGIEKDNKRFEEIISAIERAEGIIWAFPLYVFLVCAQYKRFIELIWERSALRAFDGKYAAALSTSIHFFDHTAHSYIRSICDDLNMKFSSSFSASMRELMAKEGRERLELFAREYFRTIAEGHGTIRLYQPIRQESFEFRPVIPESPSVSTDRRIAVITDSEEGNAGRMIRRFTASLDSHVDVVNLSKVDIRGGCLGCLKCGEKNICAYTGKDGYIDMYNKRLKTADILVFAGRIRDRYLSSGWKMFFDRSFFNTHQRSLQSKQFAFLISGPLSQVANLQEILSAYTEWQGSNLVDIVTDEENNSAGIDRAIEAMAARSVRLAEEHYIQPATFLGIAGMKVFRDDIWGGLKIIFKADHRAYRKSGVYDYPQKSRLRSIFIQLIYWITSIPWISRRMMKNFKELMIMPYRRVLTRVPQEKAERDFNRAAV